MLRYLLPLLITVLSFAGCTTVSPDAQRFVKADPPAAGYARLYIFRPGFSSVARYDSPALFINQKEVGRLSYESYLSLMYMPGTYQISLKPNVIESSVWDASAKISLEPDKTYFLAIWNNTEVGKGIGVMPVLGKSPFILALPTDTARSTTVRFEAVSSEQAIPVITGYSAISVKQQ